MKKSRYTFLFEVDGVRVAFNSMTCAFAEIDDNFMRIYDDLENVKTDDLSDDDQELVDNMVWANFIIPDAINELELLKYRNNYGKFSRNNLALVIAPTMECNFACPYCFEDPKKGMISQEVQDQLVEWVRDSAERKMPVDITWYGGEPLLAKDIVVDLARRFVKICEQNDVRYTSGLVTNGYLLTEEDIAKLHESHISSVQITIDGTEKTHNSRRFQKDNPTEGTFRKVVDSVKKLYAAGFGMSVRCNIDKTNIDDAKALVLYLKECDLSNALVTFGHVTSNTAYNTEIADTCLTVAEYADVVVELQEFLYNQGFYCNGYPYFPGIKTNYCGADSSSTFVVDHEGYLYKCWNEVGDTKAAIGNVLWEGSEQTPEMLAREISYMSWSPFENEGCRECKVLPICMGGCPYVGVEKGRKRCEKWRFGLVESLKKAYRSRQTAETE